MEYKSSLPVHEWLAIIAALFMMLFLVMLNVFHGSNYLDSEEDVHCISNVIVTVEGEVQVPGNFSVSKGTTLREIFELTKPTEFANTRLFDVDRVFYADALVRVPVKPVTTVYVEGAVKSRGKLQVTSGATIAEVLKLAGVLRCADLSNLGCLQRKVIGAEVIKIKYKNDEK
ncbi:MAG: SLBB domain-containing protein [Chlamydiota bacterium]|nr:SLBB domain-containing protein [Chlamydiota bacterium]